MTNLRKDARGRECEVRVPFSCNGDPETTVLAHLNGGGMGAKTDDIEGAFCCSSCHDVIDGRTKTEHSYEQLRLFLMEGAMRTRAIWRQEGKIIVN